MNDFYTLSKESKAQLVHVISELLDQSKISGNSTQFWFHADQVSDSTLTMPIIKKWLRALANKNILYFISPGAAPDLTQTLALGYSSLGDNHVWSHDIFTSVLTFTTSELSSSFAVDLCGSNLKYLLDTLNNNHIVSDFYQDKFDRIYYKNIPLDNINKSVVCKAVFSSFLSTDDFTVSVDDINKILASFNIDTDTPERRNKTIYTIRQSLHSVGSNITLESHKSGRDIDYYKLIIN